LVTFVQTLTSIRAKYPILHRSRFLTGEYDEALQVKDLTWINATGREMTAEEWSDTHMKCFGMLMDGRARPSGVQQRGTEATMLLVLNSHHDLVEFVLPDYDGGDAWKLLIDTNLGDAEPGYSGKTGERYKVTGRSLVLFIRTD
jgi:glycogen operon protein